jgi:transcriptional regulator with XRE-family HTH domain
MILKTFFKRLSGLFGEELRKNQSVIAEKLNTNPASFSRYLNGKTLPDISFLNEIIRYKKLNPEELYEFVTGAEYAGTEEKKITELPKMFVIQTKNYVKSLENQIEEQKQHIEELRHQREFLEGIVKDALKLKTSIEGHTQQDTQQETPRQTVGKKDLGKYLKKSTTADP